MGGVTIMPYFIDTQNKLHFLENLEFLELLPNDATPIDDVIAEKIITDAKEQDKLNFEPRFL